MSDIVYENTVSGELIDKYMKDMYNILHNLLPQYNEIELQEAISYSVNKHFKNHDVVIDNNYTKRKVNMDLLELSNELLRGNIIMTTQGVLFQKHGASKNPFYNFIQYLVDKRDEAKTEMKKYPKGSELYNKYNLQQLNYKVTCNALYGCCGNWSSIFYNLYLCSAVTGQGRGCISASITMFEGFLANNMKFNSITEVFTFMNNICNDLRNCKHHFMEGVLDRNVTVEECFLRIIHICDWPFTDSAKNAIWTYISNLSQNEINYIYYKNNLYRFCENSKISSLIIRILVTLKEPFLNPNKPPKEIDTDLKLLKDILYDYVYYRHIWIDKLERVFTMTRDVVLITDTDSCIVSLDEWYKFVLKRTFNIPMNIKYTREQIKEHADTLILEQQKVREHNEYDFYNDKLVAKKRLDYPLVIIEEDNLRYSIVNIMSYVVSQLILDYMVLFGENYNTMNTHDRDCLLIMKNEFLFKSLLLTNGKKQYSSIVLLQEGNQIPYDKQLDIKGMQISKVGIPKSTADRLTKILEYDILRKSFVDQIDIVKSMAALEKEIYESIKNKKKEYHKPARIKSISYYENPMIVQGIKASVTYNSIKSKDEESIDLSERNTVLIIKTKIDKKNANKIEKEFPNHYTRLLELLEKKEYKNGITSIAIPLNAEIPDWIIPFIDYSTIIEDNLKSFPIEVLGISREKNNNVINSNMVQF